MTCNLPNKREFVRIPVYDPDTLRPNGCYLDTYTDTPLYQQLKAIEAETGQTPKLLLKVP